MELYSTVGSEAGSPETRDEEANCCRKSSEQNGAAAGGKNYDTGKVPELAGDCTSEPDRDKGDCPVAGSNASYESPLRWGSALGCWDAPCGRRKLWSLKRWL